jgi:hypothetical protein
MNPPGIASRARRRLPIGRASLALLALLGLVVGCDRGDSPAEAPEASAVAGASDAPLFPDWPWFEPPADWESEHPTLSPNAKLDAHFIGLAEREMPSIAADGGGRARLESLTPIGADAAAWVRADAPTHRPSAAAATAQRIEVAFEVGEEGIDEGGLLFLMPDPFWSWSEAQVRVPEAPGYTTATPRADDVRLEPGEIGAEFLVRGRDLEPGERIDFVYGAGPPGARVDEYAEHETGLWIAVDADGDGTRRWIRDNPRLDVVARRGVRMVAFGPAEVGPGEPVVLSVAIVDANANRARWPDAIVDADGRARARWTIERLDGGALAALDLAAEVETAADPDASQTIRFVAPDTEGTLRLELRGEGALAGLAARVNPIVVRRSDRRLVWGDLHGHSRFSDGTGTPEDYFRYARDVARLDVVALTDHDHWGVQPLDENPDLAERILQAAMAFHDPGRFVTLPGYEWTSWLHGHRHVLYFDDEAPIYSSIDPATDRPDELWAALRGRDVLTFAHHSAGEPVATDWSFAPDPELEPLTEISSVHGMSEAADAPLPIRGGIPGNYVRDVLQIGYRLGFVGSGDSHDGPPGLAHLVTGQSGLAGIFTEALDRADLLDAMRARRTFATNGIRPWLEVTLDGAPMGSTIPAVRHDQTLRIRYEGTEPVERIDLVRSGRLARLDGEDAISIDVERRIPRLLPGDYHYVRIVERGGGVAWSSPIFVDATEGAREDATEGTREDATGGGPDG